MVSIKSSLEAECFMKKKLHMSAFFSELMSLKVTKSKEYN